MERVSVSIEGNGSRLKGDAIDKFQDGVKAFAASLPEGSEVIVSNFRFDYR